MIKANQVKDIISKIPDKTKVTLFEYNLDMRIKNTYNMTDEGTVNLKDNCRYIILVK